MLVLMMIVESTYGSGQPEIYMKKKIIFFAKKTQKISLMIGGMIIIKFWNFDPIP